MGVYGALFWVGGRECKNILSRWGWVGMRGGEWGWVEVSDGGLVYFECFNTI